MPTPRRSSTKAAGKPPVCGSAQSGHTTVRAKSSGQTKKADYPTVEPMTAYDLSRDPTHRHWQPSDPVVVIPGHVASFQRADEAAIHLWPHNAEKLGMVRYIPPLDEHPMAIASSLGITNADGEWEYVWFAFVYT